MIVHYSIVLEYESLYFKAIEGGVYITVAREQAIFDCPIFKERQKLKYWGGGGAGTCFLVCMFKRQGGKLQEAFLMLPSSLPFSQKRKAKKVLGSSTNTKPMSEEVTERQKAARQKREAQWARLREMRAKKSEAGQARKIKTRC